MTTVATPLTSSTTNDVGHAFGLIVGGIAATWLAHAPFVLALAATPIAGQLGLSALVIASIGSSLVSVGASYAATHFAEVREAAGFIVAIKSIKTEDTFPAQKDGAFSPAPVAQGQENGNINKG